MTSESFRWDGKMSLRRVEDGDEAEAEAGGGPFRARSGLVLIVDDDPDVRSAIRCSLPKGCEVVGLASGQDFLEMVEAYNPDLIILDVHIGDHDGFDLCRQLRQRPAFKDIPVLFLTVLNEAAGFRKLLEASGDAYLTKPFDPQELQFTVGRLLGEGF